MKFCLAILLYCKQSCKEIRESLKYALEFKGQLVHKQETVVVQQVEVIQRVLIEQYPEVWAEIRDNVAERLA